MSAVIAKVIGGLGNQMFQYAAARSLSINKNVPLYLDLSKFEGCQMHQGFELESVFSCAVNVARSEDVKSVLGWQSSRLTRQIFGRPAG